MRVEIRSRLGNIIVGALGVIYAVAALVLLTIHFIQTWGAASMTDRAIQLLLIAVIAVSGWFVSIALHGLGLRLPSRRAAAAAAS